MRRHWHESALQPKTTMHRAVSPRASSMCRHHWRGQQHVDVVATCEHRSAAPFRCLGSCSTPENGGVTPTASGLYERRMCRLAQCDSKQRSGFKIPCFGRTHVFAIHSGPSCVAAGHDQIVRRSRKSFSNPRQSRPRPNGESASARNVSATAASTCPALYAPLA